MPVLRLGTRASLLARAQSAIIAAEIKRRFPNVEIQTILIKTTGDQITDRPLHESGGKGLFIKELQQALIDNKIDFAVHSFKDVPVTMPLVDESNLIIAAVPKREDPRDVLISEQATTIAQLPENAAVATGSLRRRCQLLALRPDLRIQPIRGNIDTRIKKLRAGECDAIVLAHAGLIRAGLFDGSLMQPIPLDDLLPAPGQGALALECRHNDQPTRAILAELDDSPSRSAVDAERAVVAALNCDCYSPIAVLAEFETGTTHIRAVLGQNDGNPPIKKAASHSTGAIADIVRQLTV